MSSPGPPFSFPLPSHTSTRQKGDNFKVRAGQVHPGSSGGSLPGGQYFSQPRPPPQCRWPGPLSIQHPPIRLGGFLSFETSVAPVLFGIFCSNFNQSSLVFFFGSNLCTGAFCFGGWGRGHHCQVGPQMVYMERVKDLLDTTPRACSSEDPPPIPTFSNPNSRLQNFPKFPSYLNG